MEIAGAAVIVAIVSTVACVVLAVFLKRQLKENKNLRNQIGDLTQKCLHWAKSQHKKAWFKEIKGSDYRNELEVEFKFIEPLLRFLGYTGWDFSMRVPVNLRLGSQEVRGEADWVVFRRDSREPLLVIEAKASNVVLDDSVQGQARSYAFGLKCRYYMITNGERLEIFEHLLPEDTLLFECKTWDLEMKWGELEQIMERLKQNG